MRVSVVVNTHNRASSLRTLLEALRRQSYPDFEVVVVNGPSSDGTEALLAEYDGAIRLASCPERNLSKSRNIGIDAAAGDVVAFIDDDAIPEPRWIEELVAGYADRIVSGVGGLVLAPSGMRYQYRYSVCDRLGATSFPCEAPDPSATEPGADPFLYLQGTNASFLREALLDVCGFDEEIAYMYDEVELCAMLIDAGHRLRSLERAAVHHKFLPSHLRTTVGFTDPFHSVKNRAYLALRLGRGRADEEEIIAAQRVAVADSVAWAQRSHREGGLSAPEVARYVRRADEGLEVGLVRGREGARRGRTIAPVDPGAFLPYARSAPAAPARIVFTSTDYPPKSVAGIARFTVDLAQGMAAHGHDVHVVTRDEEGPSRVDFENGVWVHRYAVNTRFLPELEGSPIVHGLERSAAIHSVVERIHESRPVDVVCGPLWGAETLVCALDPRLRVITTCMTPLRVVAEMQERLSQKPSTKAMIALEDAALIRSTHLVPISAAVERTIERIPGVVGRPSTVLHLGVVDRRGEVRRNRADDLVEILFVGRLEARKGVDVLLRAAVEVLRRHENARLRLVGEDNAAWSAGEDWSRELAELADGERSVLSRVAFEGRFSDDELLQALADADVFVAPSRYESFGLVIAEAMMLGLPVVASDAGGIPEVAVHGETALLVPPGDADALEEALDAVVGDVDLRRRLGAAGRERFETTFDNEVVVARYLDLLLPDTENQARPVALAGRAAAIEARRAGRDLLDGLIGLRGGAADDAAMALLHDGKFPLDLEQELRGVSGADTPSVASAVMRAVLDRSPSDSELAGAVEALEPFSPLRATATWALEAAGMETDLPRSAADGLPGRRPASVLADVRRAWMQVDDVEFLTGLVGALAVPDDAELYELASRALAGGGRRSALRTLLETPRVQRRIGRMSGVETAPLLTVEEIADELRAISAVSTEEAISRSFVLLTGRPPDRRGRANAVRQLACGTRAQLLHALAGTPSAAGYGIDESVTGPLIETIDGLHRPPWGRWMRGQRPVQRLESFARGVLHDLEEAAAGARSQPPDHQEIQHAARVQGDAMGESVARAMEARYVRLDTLAEVREQVRGDVSSTHDELAGAREDIAALRDQLEQSRRGFEDAIGRVDDRMGILVAKYEALGLDIRERLPAEVQEDMPEPEVLDPSALEPGGKANLGCGEKPLVGYVNVDFRHLPGVTVVADVRRLPFAPRSLIEVVSHHLVEHFRQTHLEQVVLPHWREIISDDGWLRVVTPNLTVLTEWYRTGRLTPQEFKTVLFGLQDYAGDDHFALYSPETLHEAVERAGFTDIEILETDRPNGNSPEIELVARPGDR